MPRTRNIDKYDSTLRNIHNKRQEAVENIIISKNVQGIYLVFVPQLQVDDGEL